MSNLPPYKAPAVALNDNEKTDSNFKIDPVDKAIWILLGKLYPNLLALYSESKNLRALQDTLKLKLSSESNTSIDPLPPELALATEGLKKIVAGARTYKGFLDMDETLYRFDQDDVKGMYLSESMQFCIAQASELYDTIKHDLIEISKISGNKTTNETSEFIPDPKLSDITIRRAMIAFRNAVLPDKGLSR